MSEFRSMRMSSDSDTTSLSRNVTNNNNNDSNTKSNITKSIVSRNSNNTASISASSSGNAKQSAAHDGNSIRTKQQSTAPLPHSIELIKKCENGPPLHSFEFPKQDLSIVLERIYDVLRRASVHVVSKPAPTNPFSSSIACRSMNRVGFCISLWEKEDNNKYNHNHFNSSDVVLEMTPCNGDRLMYYKHYVKLVRSATILSTDLDTLNYDPEIAIGYRSCRTFCPNAIERRCPFAKLPFHIDDPDAVLLSAIEIAATLVQADRLDAQILGLESILFLLDENRMQSNTNFPRDVSRGILLNHDTKPWMSLHDRICTLAMGDAARPKDEKADPFEYEKSYLSLSILSKSLKILGNDEVQRFLNDANECLPSTTVSASLTSSSDRCKAFLDVLSNRIEMVDEDPHMTYHAICILESLASCHNESVQKYIHDHTDTILHAHTYGAVFHTALENECSTLLQRITT